MGSLNMYSILIFLTLTAVMALPLTEEEVQRLDDTERGADDTAAAADVKEVSEVYLKHKPGRPGHGKGAISGFRPQGNSGYYGGYPVSGPLTFPNTGYPSYYKPGYYGAGNIPGNYYGYYGY